MVKNKLEKHTVGTLDQKNLSAVSTGQEFFCIAQPETGRAHIFSQKTKKLLYSLKMNGSCDTTCFSADDRYLYTAGDQAEIYQWDLKQRRCIAKIADEGAF
jgi:hypothetical protein